VSALFEERNGAVPCRTPWGQWYQILEEVFIEVQVSPGTRAQDIQCGLQSRHVALAVGGHEILKGKLFDSTIADEGTRGLWRVEKWSVLFLQREMQQIVGLLFWNLSMQLILGCKTKCRENFQKENPRFDFSGAEISGNYPKGGPDFSNLEKYL
uniref:CS domain-containing protein n=1 Tax=Phocoena sinus TaxID=42100 RepID=A0A8C9EEW1_PHOSS